MRGKSFFLHEKYSFLTLCLLLILLIVSLGCSDDTTAPSQDETQVGNNSIQIWGNCLDGQCDIPGQNADFIAVAGGNNCSLGLKSNGEIVAWGDNSSGQCDVPAPNADFVAIAAGGECPQSPPVLGRSTALGLKRIAL